VAPERKIGGKISLLENNTPYTDQHLLAQTGDELGLESKEE